MLSFRHWFGQSEPIIAQAVAPAAPASVAAAAVAHAQPEQERPAWTPERLVVNDGLWGEGFQFPGGESETVRLAKPLGLSAACTLLLLGAGGGGTARAVAERLGVWVAGFDADRNLVEYGTRLLRQSKFGKRAQIDLWDPTDPEFDRNGYHHAMALEPLHDQPPEPILAAIAKGLKPGGQFSMVETVADIPVDPGDQVVARWAKLEHRRPQALPTEKAITRVLGRLGFDVRIAEDVSKRHTQQAMIGWRRFVRALEDKEERPPMEQAAALVSEAELWLLRLKLFQSGKLRLVRWHGIGR